MLEQPTHDQYGMQPGLHPATPTPSMGVPAGLPPLRPRRRWGRMVGVVALLLVLAALGYVGFIGYSLAQVSTRPLDLSQLSADAAGRSNILVLGEGDPGHAGKGLTDTVMVMSMDTKGKRVAQVSIPRDLRVSIPGHGSGKINSANALGGTELAAQTVSNTLGIPVNYYVHTNFSGLRQMVDAVGGLDIDVKDRLKDTEYPCDDNQYKVCGLDIQPGLQHMDGARVLQYVRCRKGTCGNDFGRAERQQEVLNLLRDKIVRWDVVMNPTKLLPLVSAVRQSLQTNLGALQMLELARDWRAAGNNNPVHLVLSTSQGGYLRSAGGSSDLVPIGGDFTAIQTRVQNIFSSDAVNPDTP